MVVSEANNPVLVTVHVQQGSTIARNKHLLTNGAPSPDIFCPSTRRVILILLLRIGDSVA